MVYGLAGLQTGITGALAMLIWLGIGSVWTRHSLWWIPNLVAAAVYGQTSLRNGPGVYTAVGAAMVFAAYGLIGVCYGEVLGERRGGLRLFCLSLIVALTVYWAALRWFWQVANPIGHFYAPERQIFVVHLLFGCFLASYPRVLRSVAGLPRDGSSFSFSRDGSGEKR
jgi:hypothetical protein